MITIVNKLVLSILFSPVATTVNNRCCFINAEQHCWDNSEHWTTLFVKQHCSAMITVLLRHCSTNNAVTTCAIFSCVPGTYWLLFHRLLEAESEMVEEYKNKLERCKIELASLDHKKVWNNETQEFAQFVFEFKLVLYPPTGPPAVTRNRECPRFAWTTRRILQWWQRGRGSFIFYVTFLY